MNVDVIQYAEMGQCRADLLHVVDDEKTELWMVAFRTPGGTRVDTLSQVLRRAGGHFGSLGQHLTLVYECQEDACQALSVLLDTIKREAGMPEKLAN
jgi:hypothetical protein